MESQTPPSSSIPDPEPSFPEPADDDLSSHFHRQFIGWLCLALPLLVWVVAGWRPTSGLPQWERLGSISAYYYTGAVAAFVGTLVALAAFLLTYQGYDNEYYLRDRVAAIIAGLSALLVAFFPTGAPSGLLGPSWWTARTGLIHYGAAAVLFGAGIFICIFQFRKTREGERPAGWKRVRNVIYVICSVVMAAGVLWAASTSWTHGPIFLPEALALLSFAVAWLVKGRVDRIPLAALRWTGHFVRHPTKIAVKARSTLDPKPRTTRSQS